MSGISTHVLDIGAGKPAAGISVRLVRDEDEIGSGVTNSDGRCPALVRDGESLDPGVYRLIFDVATRYPHSFYPEIAISFRVTDPSGHYHVPLLLSPFGYTTYRGS
jgi:5-hydroxyisourate hydrolase